MHGLAWAAALLLALGWGEVTMALEEPSYAVDREHDGYELRRYEPYLVAETWVDGSFSQSGGRAFRILAGYIFGDNAPGEKMAMTAPVVSVPAENEGYRYQFVMERAYTLDDLPIPNDARVELREIPARWVAAYAFSGSWRASRVDALTRDFLARLSADGYRITAEPLLARYDPPYMPWFLRRNELLVEVQPPGEGDSTVMATDRELASKD